MAHLAPQNIVGMSFSPYCCFAVALLRDYTCRRRVSTALDNVVRGIYNIYMILPDPLSFQWDKGNVNKNLVKHGVSNQEIEEAFSDEAKVIYNDTFHSELEGRYILLGKTKFERFVYIVFAVRNSMVRVISARDLNRKEYKFYEKAT